jgi:hypothetical protein
VSGSVSSSANSPGYRETFGSWNVVHVMKWCAGSLTSRLSRTKLKPKSELAVSLTEIFRSDADAAALNRAHGVFVLPVHEAENFFLHPETLRLLLAQHGDPNLVPLDLIRTASDARAGSWIFQYAMATPNAKSLPDISVLAKTRAKAFTWAQFDADRHTALNSIIDVSGYGGDDQRRLQSILEVSANSYARQRDEQSLWKVCEGKQVLNSVAVTAGFWGAPAMVRATFAAWAGEGAEIPEELAEFRAHLAAL